MSKAKQRKVKVKPTRKKPKKQEHVCHGVQGGAEVYCPECGKVLYA